MDHASDVRPRRKKGVWLQPEGDGVSVYDPENGSLYSLNSTAAAIWGLCDGATSVQEMALAVAEVTGLALVAAKDAVSETLSELAMRHLVETN